MVRNMIITDKNTKGEIVSLIALACIRQRGNNCSQFPPGVKLEENITSQLYKYEEKWEEI